MFDAMRHIRTCIHHSLTSVTKKASEFQAMTQKLHAFLPFPLATHVFVLSFMRGCLTLGVNDAVWLNELRYEVPSLRSKLRQQSGWHGLVSIDLKVVHTVQYQKPKVTPKKPLSAQARAGIQAACADMPDEKLRQALQALARPNTRGIL